MQETVEVKYRNILTAQFTQCCSCNSYLASQQAKPKTHVLKNVNTNFIYAVTQSTELGGLFIVGSAN